jgi:hypothetical protein
LVVYTIESEMHGHTDIKYVSYVKNADYMTTGCSAGKNCIVDTKSYSGGNKQERNTSKCKPSAHNAMV